MISYFIIIGIVFFISLLDLIKINRPFKVLLLVNIVIILILFAGLRVNIGFDYNSYEHIFNLNSITNENIEFGYSLLNIIVKDLGLSFNVLLLLIATIILLCISWTVKDYSPLMLISLFVYFAAYFFGGVMGQMRQALGGAVLIFSIRYILDRKFIKFMICVAIASSFHTVSLIFIPMYFIYSINISNKWIIISVLISLIIGQTSIVKQIILMILKIFSFIPQLSSAYNYVIHPQYGRSMGIGVATIERIIFLILAIYVCRRIKGKDKVFDLSLYSYYIATVLYLLFSNIYIFATRVAQPFKILEIIMIPYILYNIKNKYSRIIFSSVLLLILLYRTLTIISGNLDIYVPYNNILF